MGLTTAALLEAETAPTARVDWRRALRNILRSVKRALRVRRVDCRWLQSSRGEIGVVEDALQQSRLRLSAERTGSMERIEGGWTRSFSL